MRREKLSDFRSIVVGRVVDKEHDFFQPLPPSMGGHVRQVQPKLLISSALERIPNNSLRRPKECYEKVPSFRVPESGHAKTRAFFDPRALDFGKQFNPFLVLEGDGYSFFKSAAATRL